MRIVRAGRSPSHYRRLKRGPGTPLVVSDERNRARAAVCRATTTMLTRASRHGLTEPGELTGPVLELDGERTHVALLLRASSPERAPVERTPRDVG